MTSPAVDAPVPGVCVVIPTYNRCDLLRETLRSLVEQRVPAYDFEVVVSDDGSSDATREVVASFADRLRIRYVFQEDLGFRVASARNAGARLATAPVLVFLDTGVLAGPDFVAEHRAAHEVPGRVVLGYTYGYNPYDPCPGLAELLAELRPAEVVARLGERSSFRDMRHADFARVDFDLGRLAAPWMLGWTVNLSVPTGDFRAVGGFDEDFRSWGVEDLELGYRMHRHGLRSVLSPRAWAIETPHERDTEANLASSRRNATLFHDKHPEPLVELYWAIYSQSVLVPLEEEYRALLDWQQKARDVDVTGELRAATAGAAEGARIAVLGSGAGAPDWPAQWHLIEFDAELLNRARPGRGGATHALGARTRLADGSFDLVVITSRLAGLWDRWGSDVLAEARRIGRAVSRPFATDG